MDAAALVLSVLLAASPATGAAPLTESSFLDSVLAQPRIHALLAEPLALERAAAARDRRVPAPALSFEREALDGAPREDTWSVSWAPPFDGRHWLRDRAGRQSVLAAERRHELSRLTLRLELRAAYAEWALAQEGAAAGERLASIVERLARQAESRAEKGEASLLAARRLRLAQVEFATESARLAAELARARAEARAWQVERPTGPGSAPVRPVLPPVPDDATLWTRSPRLALHRHEVAAAEARVGVARLGYELPELTFGSRSTHGALADTRGPVYGVRWPLPLFDRGQADRREAHARLASARAQGELTTARVREQHAAALESYRILRTSAEQAARLEPVEERVLASATAVFDSGESDVTDLLETLRGVLAVRLASLAGYAHALRAHRELEAAAGRPLPLQEGVAP